MYLSPQHFHLKKKKSHVPCPMSAPWTLLSGICIKISTWTVETSWVLYTAFHNPTPLALSLVVSVPADGLTSNGGRPSAITLLTIGGFLAATKQLYEWSRNTPVHPSVWLTITHAIFTIFLTSYHPIWVHRWLWNDAQNFRWQRRGALLFFNIIRQILISHGRINYQFSPESSVSGLKLISVAYLICLFLACSW